VIAMEHNGTALVQRLARMYVGPERAADYVSPGQRIDVTLAAERIAGQFHAR
jgi:hypothetical protein